MTATHHPPVGLIPPPPPAPTAGVPAAEVPARIRELRPLTADELRRERLAWAERIAAAG